MDAWAMVDELKRSGQKVNLIEVGGLYNPEFIWRCSINDSIFVDAPTSLEAVTEAQRMLFFIGTTE